MAIEDCVATHLEVEKCACNTSQCRRYGIKQSAFSQGSGFNEATAMRIAESYNACYGMDHPKEIVLALVSLAYATSTVSTHGDLLSKRATEILSHIRGRNAQ